MLYNWRKINIKQGQAIIKATIEAEQSTELTRIIDRDIAILSAIHGKSVDYYESLPRGTLEQKIEQSKWTSVMPDGAEPVPFRSGNSLFRFKTYASQLSNSEFTLLQKYSTEYIENLHKIMALLSIRYTVLPPRAVIPKDTIAEFEYRSELFLNKLPFSMAYSYALFFSTYYPHLLQIGQSYFRGQMRAANDYLERNPTQ